MAKAEAKSIPVSEVLSDLQREVTCAICLGIYENPKFLPECLHTFCGKCIEEIIEKIPPKPEGGRDLRCPHCRTENNIFIEKLQRNLTAANFVEIIKKSSSVSLKCCSFAADDCGSESPVTCGHCSVELSDCCANSHLENLKLNALSKVDSFQEQLALLKSSWADKTSMLIGSLDNTASQVVRQVEECAKNLQDIIVDLVSEKSQKLCSQVTGVVTASKADLLSGEGTLLDAFEKELPLLLNEAGTMRTASAKTIDPTLITSFHKSVSQLERKLNMLKLLHGCPPTEMKFKPDANFNYKINKLFDLDFGEIVHSFNNDKLKICYESMKQVDKFRVMDTKAVGRLVCNICSIPGSNLLLAHCGTPKVCNELMLMSLEHRLATKTFMTMNPDEKLKDTKGNWRPIAVGQVALSSSGQVYFLSDDEDSNIFTFKIDFSAPNERHDVVPQVFATLPNKNKRGSFIQYYAGLCYDDVQGDLYATTRHSNDEFAEGFVLCYEASTSQLRFQISLGPVEPDICAIYRHSKNKEPIIAISLLDYSKRASCSLIFGTIAKETVVNEWKVIKPKHSVTKQQGLLLAYHHISAMAFDLVGNLLVLHGYGKVDTRVDVYSLSVGSLLCSFPQQQNWGSSSEATGLALVYWDGTDKIDNFILKKPKKIPRNEYSSEDDDLDSLPSELDQPSCAVAAAEKSETAGADGKFVPSDEDTSDCEEEEGDYDVEAWDDEEKYETEDEENEENEENAEGEEDEEEEEEGQESDAEEDDVQETVASNARTSEQPVENLVKDTLKELVAAVSDGMADCKSSASLDTVTRMRPVVIIGQRRNGKLLVFA